MAAAPPVNWFQQNAPPPGTNMSLAQGITPAVQAQPPSGQMTPAVQPNMAGPTATPSSSNPMDDAYIAQQIASYVAQQKAAGNTNLDPSLENDPNYWVQQIKNTGGWQGDNANYWTTKFATARNQTTGGPVSGGPAAFGPAAIPGMDPGLGFTEQQALGALQKSAASRGTLLTGGTLKAITDYVGNDLASNAYQGAFNRQLSLAQLGKPAA